MERTRLYDPLRWWEWLLVTLFVLACSVEWTGCGDRPARVSVDGERLCAVCAGREAA